MPLSTAPRNAPTAFLLPAYLKVPVSAGAGSAPDTDVVLYCRARLARNLAGHPFPHRASDVEMRRVAHKIKRAARDGGFPLSDLVPVSLSHLSARDRDDLVNARRISPDLAYGPPTNRFALLDEKGEMGVFVNEEDHLRLQTVQAGNAPAETLAKAQIADTAFARRLTYARDELQWGFLTASLGNVGTGLRLSVLLHLPALAFLGRLHEALQAAHVLGISVRAGSGEHGTIAGDLFQVSNAVTWGLTAAHIAGRVVPVADYLTEAERSARRDLAEQKAGGVIENARAAWQKVETAERLSAEGALNALSRLRLCAACGKAAGPDARLFAALLTDLRVFHAPALAGVGGAENREAIARPAKLRVALRSFFDGL